VSASKFETLTGEVDLAFPEYDAPPAEPVGLVRQWLAQAAERGVREPRALALATADLRGRASNRIVAITAVTDNGLVFASHSGSQKGRELAATGWASGVLYWRETGQQVVLSGPVARLGNAEANALWIARPTPLHFMSTISRQSEPIADAAQLRARLHGLEAVGMPLPRPESFVWYELQPATVEFWCASSDRLHRRLRYDHDHRGWRTCQLQP
jgi:dihydrophenazinedicarboxylate synthase